MKKKMMILAMMTCLASMNVSAAEYSTLQVGSNGVEVQQMQQALIEQGFLSGAADGAYGNGTAAGVSAFQESVGLEVTGIADEETQKALFGETETEDEPEIDFNVATDVVEFSLTDLQFTHAVSLDHSTWLYPATSGGTFGAGDGKDYLWMSFTVKNISKEKISGYDVANISVDYDDGYVFDETVYSNIEGYCTRPSISSEGLAKIDMLSTSDFVAFVKVPEEVREHKEKVVLNVVLPTSTGDETFTYALTVDENAVQGEDAKALVDCLGVASHDLTFTQKYAGNDNGKGSLKFADSMVEELQNSLSDVDLDALEAAAPGLKTKVESLQGNIDTVCSLLIDMGNTNSNANVPTIKSTCETALGQIQDLMDNELSAYK